MAKILIIGGPGDSRNAELILRSGGHQTETASNEETALEKATRLPFGSLILMDLRLSEKTTAASLIEKFHSLHIFHPVVIFASTPNQNDICNAFRGYKAVDFLQPQTFDKTLIDCVKRHLPAGGLRKADPAMPYPRLSKAFTTVLDRADRLAQRDCNILIIGEHGLGKEKIARRIHRNSSRASKLFVVISHPDFVNENNEKQPCPACHIRELFEHADGGTIFIKNLHLFCAVAQNIILSSIESGKYNVRVIATADESIREQLNKGTFNETLFHHTSGGCLELPPLRDCVDDIEPLANYFLMEYAEENSEPKCKLTPGALNILVSYTWPRNIKELKNVITQCAGLSDNGRITVEDLHEIAFTNFKALPHDPDLCEETRVANVLKMSRTLKEAADALGWTEKTLYNKRK